MFGARRRKRADTTRRRARKAAISQRRLGVETMERRLMLSATIGDARSVRIPTIDPSMVLQSSSLSQTTLTDGGFIVVAFDNNGMGASGVVVRAVDYPDLQQAPDGLYTNADSNFLDRDQAITFGNNGIHPVYLTLLYGAGHELPTIASQSTSPTEAAHSASEGGSISISNLLVSVKQEQTTTPVARTVSTTSSMTNDVHRATRANAALVSSIAGEWARPAAFETVGSERADIGHSTDDVSHVMSPDEEPAAIETEAGTVQSTRTDAAKIESDRTSMDEKTISAREHDFGYRLANGAVAELTMTRDSDQASIIRTVLATDQGMAVASAAASPLTIDGALGASVLGTEISESKIAAFDAIGRVESSSPMWEKSRGAAALVSILALERISAMNARQSERESTDPAIRRGGALPAGRRRISELAGLGMR